MEAIERKVTEGIAIEKFNFVRATMNEAFRLKNNLIEDNCNFNKIIVDLSECDYIDSTFLGALIYSYRRIKERNGILVLIIGHTQLSKSFIYDEISKMFRVFRTLEEAVNELSNKNKLSESAKLQQIQLNLSDRIDCSIN